MPNGDFNIVWVLGAGFSRSLGGPLLDDFFSVPVRERVMARTPGTGLKERFTWLHTYYRSEDIVVKRRDGHWPHPWKNAEDFSELLETAALRDSPDVALRAQATLQPHPTGTPAIPWTDYESWARVCRQYLAAACHEFVDAPASVKVLERWVPYRNWAKNVWPRDRIVSFNYDLVAERVCKTTFEVILPTRRNYPQDQPNAAQLLKLHGSVNWIQSDPEGPVFEQDPFEIMEQDRSPMIATPGPRKIGMIAKVMEPLWRGAALALRRAQVVVFVGYRFPESDVEAKKPTASIRGCDRPDGPASGVENAPGHCLGADELAVESW